MTKEISYSQSSFCDKAFEKHSHESYSISFITDGSCHFDKNDTKYIASKNDIRIINPFESHEIYCSSWSHINLVPTASFIENITQQSDVKFKPIIKDIEANRLFLSFYTSLKEKDAFMEIEIKAIEFFSYLFYTHSYNDEQITKIPKNWLKSALKYINDNANSHEISIDAITKNIGISKYHFIREFKKHTGISPYRYIQNIKINNARAMLHNGKSLSFIAQECGFYDQSHMIKVYRQFYGHSPSKVEIHSLK